MAGVLNIIASGQISMTTSAASAAAGSDFNLANFPDYVAVYESPYIDGTNQLSVGSTSASWTTISSPKRIMSRGVLTDARVLPQENTNNSPFGFLGTSDIGVTQTRYAPVVNNLQYLDETVYIAYDFRESGTASSGGPYVSLLNEPDSYTNIQLNIFPSGTGTIVRLYSQSSLLRQLNSPSGQRSGVAAVSIKYNQSLGTASYVMYFNSASYTNSTSGFAPPFMTGDINTLQLVFNKPSASFSDWVGVHALVMCASVHSAATVSTNLSYLSTRYGVFL